MSRTALLRDVSRILLARPFDHFSDRQLLEQFSATRADDAFAALLARHAGMVRGVCRRVLGDPDLADDAFQATFVVLANKAGSLRQGELLANWLFGVARRISLKALARRRRAAESERAAAALRPEAAEPRPWDDLLRTLDEELGRLPGRYRRPLIACCIDGRTQDEAADELGWSARTLRRRLARARELLRVRLAARGVTLSAGLLVAAVAPKAVEANVLESALAAALGRTMTPAVAGLAAAAVPTMMGTGIRLGVAAALAVSLIVGGLAWRPAGMAPADERRPELPSGVVRQRDRFNDPLPLGAVARLGTVALRHGGEVNRLTFSEDGKTILSHGGGVIRRWQVDTGHEVEHFDFREDGRRVRTCAVGSDGKMATIVFSDPEQRRPSSIEVRDLATGLNKREFTIRAGESQVLSPDGRLLASYGNHLEVFDLKTGQSAYRLPLGRPYFSADGLTLVIGDVKHTITVWDAKTGQLRRSFGGELPHLAGLALSPDGKWLVSQKQTLGELRQTGPREGVRDSIPDKFLRVWNVNKGELVGTLETGLCDEQSFSFAPDGRTLLVVVRSGADYRHAIQRWDVASRKLLATWPAGLEYYRAVALSVDGKTLTTAGEGCCVHLWDVARERELGTTDVHQGPVWLMAFSPDGQSVRTLGRDQTMIDWDAASGKPTRRREEPKMGGGVYTYSADGRYRAAVQSARDGRIVVWDLERDRLVQDFGPKAGENRGISLSADGRQFMLVTRSESKTMLRAWDTQSGKRLSEWEVKAGERDSFFPVVLADGRVLMMGQGQATGRELFRWSVADGAALSPNDAHSCTMTPSPNEQLIACCVPGRAAELRETGTGRLLRRLKGEVEPHPLAFSSDGKRFAATTGGIKPTVVVWDVETGKVVREWSGHRGRIIGLAFSPDGKRLASGSEDCTALIWRVEP